MKYIYVPTKTIEKDNVNNNKNKNVDKDVNKDDPCVNCLGDCYYCEYGDIEIS